jgi:DNA topoisomerase-3
VLESTVSEIRTFGWRLIQYSEGRDREENEVKPSESVAVFKKGDNIRIAGCNLLTKKTLPPPLYTGATLLSAIENASPGTPEVRAEMIETLLSGNYIQQWEQNFMPSEKGLVFYNCVKDRNISDIKLTESWEKALQNVRQGKQNADSFMTMFEIFTKQATKEILTL